MNTKRKLIFTSVASLAILASVVSGATYALFTSTNEHQVVVNTAKVEYETALEVTGAGSLNGYEVTVSNNSGVFENTGSFSYADGKLTLTNVTPGDYVKFKVNITNNSTVTTQYRVKVVTTDEVGNHLVATGPAASWNKLEATVRNVETEFEVKLLAEAGNEYQDKSLTVDIVIEASQGNAITATSAETLKSELNSGAELVVLTSDIEAPTAIEVEGVSTVDLNGKEVSVPTDTIGDGVFHVVDGGELTIDGEGTINGVADNDYNMAVWVDIGSKVVINNGTYTNVGASAVTDPTHMDLIYVKGGELVINGGFFEAETPQWTINCNDANPGTVTITGGTFVEFDPSNPQTEPSAWYATHPNGFVADGYTVVSEVVDGKTHYTVVKA